MIKQLKRINGAILINAVDQMGMGVLATLIVGTLLRQMAVLLGDGFELLFTIGTFAQTMMAVGVAIGAAQALKAKPAVLFGTVVTTLIGAGAINMSEGSVVLSIGDPAAAFVTALASILIGKAVSGKTKLDIMITPMFTLIGGGLVGVYAAPYVTSLTGWIGFVITTATDLHPIWMGIVVAIIFCFVILSPLSSSALAIGLGLSGIAAGAALAGTAASMVGFAVISFADNGLGGLVSQGIGTSKIQFGNFVKNPAIFLPTMLAAAIGGPLSTMVFHIQTNSLGAGMGTSGLVGQIQTLYVMGTGAALPIFLVQVMLPVVISFFTWKLLVNLEWIKSGDMVLPKA